MPTLSLGYLTIPVSIEASIYANQYEISPSSVLSIIGFGPTPLPPHMLPTMAKFILTMESTLTMAQKELFGLLYESLQTNSYGIIPLSDRYIGLLLPLKLKQEQQEPSSFQFILQISSIPNSFQQDNNKMKINENIPSFDPDYLKHLPIQIMELCQNNKQDQLRSIAKEIYKMATIYGYWDLWLVLEGICTRFQINSQQLVQ
ncbi:hypothetical protein INT45_008764 [Circinella minor]|uniref:Uncharacterized protein n=1 Tax=Circinella minor TaxID=1195481 RepID=A0A8H7VL73_9FUNG|nr:hypothetical protein INT45_008764 [Circinella minor]